MYTKKVKYEDYLGETHEENVSFNLTKIEMLKFQTSVEGGLDKYIEKLQKENDPIKMVLFFDMFVKAAYGKISDDGTRFIKNKELTEEFSQSAAYDTLFSQIISDPNLIQEFLIGCVPKEFKSQITAEMNKQAALNSAE